MSDTPQLRSHDIVILNAARNILRELEDDWRYASRENRDFDAGYVASVAKHAEHAIFDALSAQRVYGEQALTDEEVHGKDLAAPVSTGMSVADTLSDAVTELDGYIAEQAEGSDGWGEANPRGPYFAELLDVRDRMNKLREKIDALYKDAK